MFSKLRHWYYTKVKGYLCWNDMTEHQKATFFGIVKRLCPEKED